MPFVLTSPGHLRKGNAHVSTMHESGVLIAAFAGMSAFFLLLGGMKPVPLRCHMIMGTLGASITAVRSAGCTLCPKTMEYLDKIRSGFSSTLDHSKRAPLVAAVFYVRAMRTKVVPIKEVTYFDYLQDSYNEKPVDPLYRPGLLSYMWRLAVHMSNPDPYQFANDDAADPESHPSGEPHYLRAILLFCRYVTYLGLADYVEMCVFFDRVIYSHMHRKLTHISCLAMS